MKISTLLIVFAVFFLMGCTTSPVSCDDALLSEPRFDFSNVKNSTSVGILFSHVNLGDVYSIEINKNLSYRYIRQAPSENEHEGILTESSFDTILNELIYDKFNHMRSEYRCADATDLGTRVITLKSDDQSYSVEEYGNYGPAEFHKIFEKIWMMIDSDIKKNDETIDLVDIELKSTSEIINTKTIGNYEIETIDPDNQSICGNEESHDDCICPNGYLRVFEEPQVAPLCFPEICQYVYGLHWLGDSVEGHVGSPNYLLCVLAIKSQNSEYCDDINYQQGKDICTYAYSKAAKDNLVCDMIVDEYLKNECQK